VWWAVVRGKAHLTANFLRQVHTDEAHFVLSVDSEISSH